MTTISPAFSLPFLRDIEVCPYSEGCRYAEVCVYQGACSSSTSENAVRLLQDVAVTAVQSLLGGTLLMGGVALTLTLFLLPLGLPMALLGVALLNTSGERSR